MMKGVKHRMHQVSVQEVVSSNSGEQTEALLPQNLPKQWRWCMGLWVWWQWAACTDLKRSSFGPISQSSCSLLSSLPPAAKRRGSGYLALLICQANGMELSWLSRMEETEHQFKSWKKSVNLSSLILLSVLIWGTLPHSTPVEKGCPNRWCHHHWPCLTLPADSQSAEQVNKSPGTWTHSGVLLQWRYNPWCCFN